MLTWKDLQEIKINGKSRQKFTSNMAEETLSRSTLPQITAINFGQNTKNNY